MSNFRETTDEQFKQDIASGTVIVDVWAEWCGPCKMLLPLVESLASAREDVTFLKLNADKTSLMGELQIRSVPTLLKYVNGELVDRQIGSMSASQLAAFVGE